MSINLKNYTSTVPAVTSMGRIEQALVKAGATDISKKYEDGICVSITFRMMVQLQPLFFQLPADVIEKMEHAAGEHKRFNAITFKILEYNTKKIVIQISQGRNAAKVYHNAKRLAEIVHETFDRFFPDTKVMAHPDPFIDTPVSKVDVEWINKQMLTAGVKLKTISDDTGLNYSYLSSMVNGNEPLSQLMKAFFWYYFLKK